jgi:hypothetical protein
MDLNLNSVDYFNVMHHTHYAFFNNAVTITGIAHNFQKLAK